MGAVFYTSIKGEYSKVPCTLDDIDTDVQTIKDILLAQGEVLENEQEYIDNMVQSIYQDKAFAIYKDGVRLGFMYNREDKAFPRRLVASSLVAPKDPIAMVILMMTINLGKYKFLIVFPHGRNLISFKSFITRKSMRMYNCGARPYVKISPREHSTTTLKRFIKLFQIKKVR